MASVGASPLSPISEIETQREHVEVSPYAGALELLLMQATRFCNIDCKYCYLPSRNDKSSMSLDTVRQTASRVFASPFVGNAFTVVWHAGEPMVASRCFYEAAVKIFRLAAPEHVEVRHYIQTNGTLIDDEWAKFFSSCGFNVGLSIDGPKDTHDAKRTDRKGSGTHDRVMRGIDCLRRHEVSFRTISVVHSQTVQDGDAFWDFFDQHGIRDFALNIEEAEGTNPTSSLDSVDDESVRSFLTALFERYATSSNVRIREFDGFLGVLLTDEGNWSDLRPQTARPFAIINVDVDGNFSTFSPELLGQLIHGRKFHFGNVHRDTFESAIETEWFRQVHAEIESGIEKCRNQCAYYGLCRGGCPSNKYAEVQSFAVAETNWCRRAKQMVADVVMSGLEEHLQRADRLARR